MTVETESVLAIVDLRSQRIIRRIPEGHVSAALAGRSLSLPPVAEADVNDVAHRRVLLAGVSVDLAPADEIAAAIGRALAARRRPPMLIGSVNLDHVHHFGARRTGVERRVGEAATWLMTLDGAPIAWAAHRLTGEQQERVCGSDFLPVVLAVAARGSYRVGFLGGTEESRDRLAGVLRERYPDLAVAGHWTPGRAELDRPASSGAVADEIRAAGVDLLVVGLGKPRQELWLEQYAERTGVSVALAYGAAADFLAGVVVRAPEWAREHGLEWAYRLSLEPRRLARRYLLQGARAFPALMSIKRELNSLVPVVQRVPHSHQPASTRAEQRTEGAT